MLFHFVRPWQYRFSVPYDPLGLARLYEKTGGVDLCSMLEEMQVTSPVFHIGTFEGLIKEQTEMVELTWGQYAHNDQPVHHILYLYGAIDGKGYTGSCAARGQYWLRKAMRSFYKPDINMFVGDEDNGENGAWFVLSSIGLYALSPASGKYVFGSPLFEEIEINISDALDPLKSTGNATKLIVKAVNNSPSHVYIQNIYWNENRLVGTNSIAYSELVKGGTLTFEMGPQPMSNI